MVLITFLGLLFPLWERNSATFGRDSVNVSADKLCCVNER
jgi:hypothetical protein